jgi:hypothetical protein
VIVTVLCLVVMRNYERYNRDMEANVENYLSKSLLDSL